MQILFNNLLKLCQFPKGKSDEAKVVKHPTQLHQALEMQLWEMIPTHLSSSKLERSCCLASGRPVDSKSLCHPLPIFAKAFLFEGERWRQMFEQSCGQEECLCHQPPMAIWMASSRGRPSVSTPSQPAKQVPEGKAGVAVWVAWCHYTRSCSPPLTLFSETIPTVNLVSQAPPMPSVGCGNPATLSPATDLEGSGGKQAMDPNIVWRRYSKRSGANSPNLCIPAVQSTLTYK